MLFLMVIPFRDSQTAFEAFQKGELQASYEVTSTLMIPYEFQRMQAILGIRKYFSEELYEERNSKT